MTEIEVLSGLVEKNTGDGKLGTTNFLENRCVKEYRDYLRKCNAAQNRGEFSEQLQEWILNKEPQYREEISGILKEGNHKVLLAYYGMVYTILEYTGCYLKGKNSSPICITRSKYCSCLKLEERLKSKNVRKAIAGNFYGHKYHITIASRKNGDKVVGVDSKLKDMEPIFEKLANEINANFVA